VKLKGIFKDTVMYLLGCLIYSGAVSMIISPNGISPGGFTGLATSINYISGFNTGTVLLILNLPILFLAFYYIGTEFIVRTFIATFLLSFSLGITDTLLPQIKINSLLASIFGGIIMGMGLSIILRFGATTGGVDIIAKLVNMKRPHFSIGKIILLSDLVVITFAAVCYKNVESALYSIIAIYVSSRVTDTVIYGLDKGKTALIISDNPDILCSKISKNLKRGVTKIKAYGGYTNKEKGLLICTARSHEIYKLTKIIGELDPTSFVILNDATEIYGQGFKKI